MFFPSMIQHRNPFISLPVQSTGSCCCHFDLDIGLGVSHTLKFCDKGFYVMGKVLSDKLPCRQRGPIAELTESFPVPE